NSCNLCKAQLQPWVFHEMGLNRIALGRAMGLPEIGAPVMDQIEERAPGLLRNLATHAGPARDRLCLSRDNAAGLACLPPEVLAAIETGNGRMFSPAELTHVGREAGQAGCVVQGQTQSVACRTSVRREVAQHDVPPLLDLVHEGCPDLRRAHRPHEGDTIKAHLVKHPGLQLCLAQVAAVAPRH
ncbi:hypothetical protein MKK65_07880, partial [Methylobacterium sp. J-001]|uniref:hypothetical protein n=1 Tax=Methylobacterium sp. J-001 TaxID=2836609 RepID=UPI001FBACCCA